MQPTTNLVGPPFSLNLHPEIQTQDDQFSIDYLLTLAVILLDRLPGDTH